MIAITNRKLCKIPFAEQLELVAAAGPELIILREKDLSGPELEALAQSCLDACGRHGVPMSVNTATDVAERLGVFRVHLPMPVLRTADVSPFDVVGASVHSPEEAVEAVSLGADYLIAGHVFPTACKIGEPRGTGCLEAVVEASEVPVYAVGGVTPENYDLVLEAGASGAAAMSSVMSRDPSHAICGMPPSDRAFPFRSPYLRCRAPSLMDEAVFSRAADYIRDLFEGDGSGHDFYHSIRVHDLARRICAEEGGDEDVVRLAALLHDADDRKLFHTEGLANARRFLDSEDVPAEVSERVLRIIPQISFKGADSVVPDTLEGRIVQDADRLDAIGAVGIARAFAYGGSRGRPMHVPGEAWREGMSEAEYYANKGTTVNHFHEKLLLLRDMMNTPTARRIADHRHEYMAGFLDEFLLEWDGRRRLRGCVGFLPFLEAEKRIPHEWRRSLCFLWKNH